MMCERYLSNNTYIYINIYIYVPKKGFEPWLNCLLCSSSQRSQLQDCQVSWLSRTQCIPWHAMPPSVRARGWCPSWNPKLGAIRSNLLRVSNHWKLGVHLFNHQQIRHLMASISAKNIGGSCWLHQIRDFNSNNGKSFTGSPSLAVSLCLKMGNQWILR